MYGCVVCIGCVEVCLCRLGRLQELLRGRSCGRRCARSEDCVREGLFVSEILLQYVDFVRGGYRADLPYFVGTYTFGVTCCACAFAFTLPPRCRWRRAGVELSFGWGVF